MRLYELTDELVKLLEADDITEEELEAVQMSFDEKIEGYAKLIRCLEAEEKAYAQESKRFQEHRKARAGKIERLKAYMLHHMNAAGVERVKGQLHTVAVQNNSRPSIEPTDLQAVDERWLKFKCSLDSDAVWKYVQETGEIPENVEIHLGQHIRIR